VWEDSLTHHLRRSGVTTMLVSDHPHLFETGGENYHTDFHAWDYVRGHESDPWRTRPDPSFAGAPTLPGPMHHHYDDSRTWFREETDYPGPRTMAAAAEWLGRDAPHHDRFFLLVDEFDPHEPFDTPEPWASMYLDAKSAAAAAAGPRPIWPPYVVGGLEKGVLDETTARTLRASYGAKLSMIDHWFGRVLDALDATGGWDDTAVIVCTDHGHYLGEKDIWGKPGVPVYETMGHIPLLVAWPGVEGGRTVDALTSTVDIFATVADVFGVDVPQRTHGHSLVPLVDGTATSIREWALTGIWGREVHVTDGHVKLGRAPVDGNRPLSMWSNRWSTMPVAAVPELRLPRPDRRATLDYMPGSDVPVIRQPFGPDDQLPYWALLGRFAGDVLYDVDEDPGEERNLAGGSSRAESEALDRLRAALEEVDAPADQFARLGLA
jgi:arylsulfatase A-like enzyme